MRANILYLFLIVGLISFSSCDDDDDVVGFTGNEVSFPLFEVDGSDIEGMALFAERNDGSILVRLIMSRTTAGNTHPAHIHQGTASMGGDIAISLTPVDGSTGQSETIITQTDAGNSIGFEELTNFDGYINVHKSETELDVLLAQGDMGQNALTGNAEFYQLFDPQNPNDALANVAFKERENGETLVEIQYFGSFDTAHPNHIHDNSVAIGGPIAITLNVIEGEWTRTNVAQLDDGTAISYSELIEYKGHINVHRSADDLSVIAAGDIGANEFTGNSTEFALNEVNSSGVAGVATFYERNDGTTLVLIKVAGVADGSSHPAHIHQNSVSTGGPVVISLNSVESGSGFTEVDNFDDGLAVNYSDLIIYPGHIKVHKSNSELDVILAQGNIQ
ncbi:MAG: CHRD domain-containing protein [Candidatus Cyclobacteriaceae bacterium M2_1C_046]